MNRRIRNRTYGGVGGRRAQARLLPDRVFDALFFRRLFYKFEAYSINTYRSI